MQIMDNEMQRMNETAKQLSERLYKELVDSKIEPLIVKYDLISGDFEFHPYRHSLNDTTESSLVDALFDNIVFYAFEDNEIAAEYKRGNLEDIRKAARMAYIDVIPKTEGLLDGLLGELVLDAMLRSFYPQTKTIMSRVKYIERFPRKDIKIETHGYDSMVFSEEAGKISIWLGQVKTGDWSYCARKIKDDLNKNILKDYFAGHMLILATYKRGDDLGSLNKVVNDINDIKFDTVDLGEEEKYNAVINYFTENDIQITMPALLLFQEDKYLDADEILESIKTKCKDNLSKSIIANDENLNIKVMFLVFPVRDLKKIRTILLELRQNVGERKQNE